MFVIKQSATFKWPVVVELPADGGKTVRHTFDAEFKRMGKAEMRALWEKLGTPEGVDEVIRAALVGWSGVNDGDQALPFSEQALMQLLDIPTVSGAILQAFTAAVSGEAARKN